MARKRKKKKVSLISILTVFISLIVILTLICCGVFFTSENPGKEASVYTSSSPAVSLNEKPDESSITVSGQNSSPTVSEQNSSTVSIPDTSEPIKTPPAVQAPDGSYYIEMKNILQRPELPTGCEATALTIVLNHLDYNVEKCKIVDTYLPKTTKKYSMNTHFIGDPYSKNGIGCYAPVIVTTAENFFKDNGNKHNAKNITGATAKELYQHVSEGKPVICWVTIAMTDTYVAKTWIAENNGENVEFYINEHTTVLVGYDTVKKTVTLNDPWKGIVTYSMELFEKRYNQLGSQAIIIQ